MITSSLKDTLGTGAFFHCRHPLSFSINGVGQVIIKTLLWSWSDHVAVILREGGVVYVVEASFRTGKVTKCTLEDWFKIHPGVKIKISDPTYHGFNDGQVASNLNAQVGKDYDTEGVLWFSFLYELVRKVRKNAKWFGPTHNGLAAVKLWCAELAEMVHGIKHWYKATTKSCMTSEHFYLRIPTFTVDDF